MDRSLVSRYISRADLGKVVQAKVAQTTTDFTRAANTFGDWTNMSTTIVPSSVNSTFVIVLVSPAAFNNGAGGDNLYHQIVRDSTALAEPSEGSIAANPSGGVQFGSAALVWQDSPAVLTTLTYKAQVRSTNSYSITWRWGALAVFEVLP